MRRVAASFAIVLGASCGLVSDDVGRFNLRFGADNLADSRYNFTQGSGSVQERERSFVLGRTFSLSVGLNVF